MKKLLLVSSIFSVSLTFAQITLQSGDFATGGDTIRMSQANDNGYDFQATGAGYSWDFSSLVPVSQTLKDFRSMSGAPAFVNFTFGVFAPLKYQASYFIESTAIPIAQITSFLPVTIEDIFQFTRINTVGVTSVGFSLVVNGQAIPFKSDTIEKRYELPVAFGNSHFSRGYTNIDFNPIIDATWNQHRTRTTNVDGYGSITTPYGAFEALRIKHDITEIDSLYFVLPIFGGTWIPLPIPSSHEYEWWTNGEKEPILKITTNEIGGNETISSIEYRDIYRGLDAGISELPFTARIYPNPTHDNLYIVSTKKIESIRIIDARGVIQFEKTNDLDFFSTLDISELASGTYQIQLISASKTSQQTFIKE
jgi:hypothetical protein